MQPFGSLARLITLILIAAGAPFACIGLYEAAEAQQAINESSRAVGTVVDNSYTSTVDGTTVSGAYYPVVEFITADGRRVRFTDGIGSLPPDYAVGVRVPVLYDAADPHAARIHSWKRVWFAPTLFIAIGALPAGVFLVWQAGMWLGARLRRPPRAAPPGYR